MLDMNGNVQEEKMPVAEYTIDGEETAVPPIYPAVTLPDAAPPSPVEKKIVLNMAMSGGKMVFTINGKTGDKIPMEEFTQGVPVRFTLLNKSMPFHPFHVHGQFFQILTRGGAPSKEPGLKDTVLLYQNEEVKILTYFENRGEWMYHCHIPEHSENGMMAEIKVVPSP
ncbi:MAG: multicopper oxidase domain-containing protein [Minicystis sp.]